MGLETATYISELVATNPVGSTDAVSTLDNHDRLIKTVLQAQFPNFTAAAMTSTVAELNTLDGITATTAELNILDGVTALAADLNVMAGANAAGVTPTEIGYVNGVTSAIQTQLDGKQAADSTLTELGGVGSPSAANEFIVSSGAGAWTRNTAASARINMGLGAVAELASVDLTANVTGILPIANGGTGASTKVAAQEALGIYAGHVDSAATAEDIPSGWTSAVRNAAGDYTITHGLNLTDVDKFNITVTADSAADSKCQVTNKTANAFDVHTRQQTGAQADRAFDFVCVDRN